MILSLKKNLGWAAVLALSFFPVAIWAAMSPLGNRFLNFYNAMTSLGQITGLIGMAMFSVSLILSARLKFLDKYFYGLNNVYNQHHVIGAAAFILLLFHPLFLAAKYAQFSLRDAALFLLPSGNEAINDGIAALVLMIILLVITFYARIKYQHWKISHKLMIVVFFISISHSLGVTSDISRDAFLRFYILNLAGIGVVCGIWQAFIGKYVNSDYEYEIIRITRLGGDMFKLDMAPKKEPMKYESGQFIFINFRSVNVSGETHPFSISSPPNENNLQIVIKSLGDYTSRAGELKIGDRAFVDGPFGKFSYKEASGKSQIWIAGGVGITPFLSMAKSLNKEDACKIDLYYCTKNKGEAVLMDELSKISSENKNFEAVNWCSEENGHIEAQAVFELSGEVKGKDIFLCGPPVFMESLKNQFVKSGVPGNKIHWERFNFK